MQEGDIIQSSVAKWDWTEKTPPLPAKTGCCSSSDSKRKSPQLLSRHVGFHCCNVGGEDATTSFSLQNDMMENHQTESVHLI